jgi:hypothetical protein
VEDSTGSKVWRQASPSTWQEPVANHAALPTAASPGEVRVALDTSRAFVFDDSTSTWVALAVDQNGDLTVPAKLNVANSLTVAGDVNINSGQLEVARSITTTGDISAGGNLNVAKNIQANDVAVTNQLTADYVNVTNSVRVNGSLAVQNGLSASLFGFIGSSSFSSGVACSTKGLIVPDSTKTRLLICNGSHYIYVQ